MVEVAVLLPIQALVISLPGANIWTQVPQLEKEARESNSLPSNPAISEAPMEMALAIPEGVYPQALALLFPAATTTGIFFVHNC